MSGVEARTTEAGNRIGADVPTGCPLHCRPAPEAIFDLAGHRVLRCPACALFFLRAEDLRPASLLERSEFEDAFYDLRTSNYQVILGHLQELGAGQELLDVGCSSGWFLEQARRHGYRCRGIEPDDFFFERARRRLPAEVELVHGFFDRDLPAAWTGFDVITFHDVFEHLPHPIEILGACRRRLQPNGWVVLSVPSAAGFVFTLSRWFYRLGATAPLERMFQLHYPYPHLFYFDRRSIAALAQRSGFEVVRSFGLRALSARGSFHRARMDRASSWKQTIRNGLAGSALVSFALLQYVLPPDNEVFILKPKPL
ncbi:MAG TPA: class I SAM-dependent methyltransferase [Terriglobales bacterium]|nr:class I SAM-dependent methyltransferase [Terriglobales bacterium]